MNRRDLIELSAGFSSILLFSGIAAFSEDLEHFSIETADVDEFSIFWPAKSASALSIFVCGDNISTAAVLKFVIPLRHNTIMDVSGTLLPRFTPCAGNALMTSMTHVWPGGAFNVTAQPFSVSSPLPRGPRVFDVDFAGTEGFEPSNQSYDFCADQNGNVELSASHGTIESVAIRRSTIADDHRVSLEYQPEVGIAEADLRCVLLMNGKPISEVWVYR